MEHIHATVFGKAIPLQQKYTENPGEIVPEASQIQDALLFGQEDGVEDASTWEKHPEAINELSSGGGSSWILGTITYRPRRSDPIIAVRGCDSQHWSSSGSDRVIFSFPRLRLWFPTQHQQVSAALMVRRSVTRWSALCCTVTSTESKQWWLTTGGGRDQPPSKGRRLRLLQLPGAAPEPQTRLERSEQLRSFRVVAGEAMLKKFIRTAGYAVRANICSKEEAHHWSLGAATLALARFNLNLIWF